jgi:hypothetical protein
VESLIYILLLPVANYSQHAIELSAALRLESHAHDMALAGTEFAPVRVEENPSGWSIQMRDDHGADVRVLVTDLALDLAI